MIKKYSRVKPVKMMCRVLSVSSSGYYDWCTRPRSLRARKNEELTDKVKEIFHKEKSRVGAIRISKRLKAEGITAGRHRISKIMKSNGLKAKATKKYKATTNSNHKLPVAPNLLGQNFEANKANVKWVCDITYIWTEEGWIYLAAVVDLYSRMVIGWCMSERMTTSIVIDALTMALFRRGMPGNVIVHSDRGVQYCSYDYQSLLKKYNLICSMSKKGDCFDNAAMESWNHSLKVEAIHGEKFRTREEAKNHIFDYIEVYYNRVRLHSRLGYCSPEHFESKAA